MALRTLLEDYLDEKKTFYQTNIAWQVGCFLVLASAIGFFVLSVLWSPAYAIVGFLLLFFFIKSERNSIHLDNNKIYMKGEIGLNKDKIQYYSEVMYSNIETLDVIWMNRNSKGEIIRSHRLNSLVAKPYLSITDKQGVRTNFLVLYISKKDTLKLIDEIQARMKAVGNDKQLINKEELLEKLARKTTLMDA